MANKTYDIEFKLQVVKTYMESPNGMRIVARSFGLPSKNYIENWIKELKKKGLIPQDMKKLTNKSKENNDSLEKIHSEKSPREIMLEKENLRLKAENDLLKKLAELEGGLRVKK